MSPLQVVLSFALLAFASFAQSDERNKSPAPNNMNNMGRPRQYSYTPRTRRYYIQAEEGPHDYVGGSDTNLISGIPFSDPAEEDAAVFVDGPTPTRVGSTYIKARYVQYTDGTWSTPSPIAPEFVHLHFLGPVIRCVVGDKLEVVFRNNASFPYSIHPHGVQYFKGHEGAPYEDGTEGVDKEDDHVMPGNTFTYVWRCLASSGPGPSDKSSVMWAYHSHVDEPVDINSGLVGTIIVADPAYITSDALAETAVPNDVDREFVVMLTVSNENLAHYLEATYQYLFETEGVLVGDDPDDPDGQEESNLMHGLNGRMYGHLTGLVMNLGERVRWYLFAFGTEVDLHTAHFHGNTVLHDGHRRDAVLLAPATFEVADMVPETAGVFLFHCHVDDHIMAGMTALYTVNDPNAPSGESGHMSNMHH